jgi:ketosteroid isomerase-like protein
MKQLYITVLKGLFIPLLLLPFLLPAQNASNEETQKLLEGYVKDFAKAYANLPESKDKSSVLKYFSKRMQSTIFYFSVSDNVRMTNSGFDGFSKYMNQLMTTEGMEIRYDVTEVLQNYVNEGVATVVAVIDYELQQADGFHVKGQETVTFAWKKIGGEWQIVHFTVMGTEDEKLRGTCLCEIFASSGDEYVVRTTVPNGRSYNTGFSEFETRKSGEDIFIKVKSDNAVFKLTGDGEVWHQDGTSNAIDKMNEVSRIGKAGGVKGAILLVIKHHIYPGNCTSIKYND